jgi:hypothetical protein
MMIAHEHYVNKKRIKGKKVVNLLEFLEVEANQSRKL